MDPAQAAAEVARYYDVHTARFLARGVGGTERVIHRGLWTPGVTTPDEAAHGVHRLVLAELMALDRPQARVLDLGCGVGASLHYVLDRVPQSTGFGVTVSDVQLRIGRASCHPRATLTQADFCRDALPGDVDLAFAIESFVHASDPQAFFCRVAQVLRPCGRLVIIDDFATVDPARDQLVQRFVRYWRVPSLMTPRAADVLADAAGLTRLSDRDLTPHLRLSRWQDVGISVVSALSRPFPWLGPRLEPLHGGNALRRCLQRGLVTYRCCVWSRPDQQESHA